MWAGFWEPRSGWEGKYFLVRFPEGCVENWKTDFDVRQKREAVAALAVD